MTVSFTILLSFLFIGFVIILPVMCYSQYTNLRVFLLTKAERVEAVYTYGGIGLLSVSAWVFMLGVVLSNTT